MSDVNIINYTSVLARIGIALSLLLCQSLSYGDEAKDYNFPVKNAFKATIGISALYAKQEMPLLNPALSIKENTFVLDAQHSDDPLLDVFYQANELKFVGAWQTHEAPLIFIIAGTGASYHSYKTNLLKKIFYQQGFHVIQISSPTSYDFMVSASTSHTPGISSEDAKDLYRVMQQARDLLVEEEDIKISGYAVTGYSLGGLNAAFVGALDEQKKDFNFAKVLMLNPPVNLYRSISRLDQLVMADVPADQSIDDAVHGMFNRLSQYYRAKGALDMSSSLAGDLLGIGNELKNENIAHLISLSFRISVADMNFVSDEFNHRGEIDTQRIQLSDSSSLTEYFKTALNCDFNCYIQQQVMPEIKKTQPYADLDTVIQEVSLYKIKDYLSRSDNVMVMTNQDDLIINANDLAWLKDTLPNRLIVYPHGGHCGNYQYADNIKDMWAFMAPMIAKQR